MTPEDPPENQPPVSPAKPGPAEHLREYQFKPGQSGNPGGRPKGESLTTLLRRRLDEEHNGRRIADIVIEALIKGAVQGKHPHLKELLDRVDGKVSERVQVEGEPQGLIINLVRREGPFHPLSTMAREQAARAKEGVPVRPEEP